MTHVTLNEYINALTARRQKLAGELKTIQDAIIALDLQSDGVFNAIKALDEAIEELQAVEKQP